MTLFLIPVISFVLGEKTRGGSVVATSKERKFKELLVSIFPESRHLSGIGCA